MGYPEEMAAARTDPARLEALYRAARTAGQEADFRAGLAQMRRSYPDDLLLAAWHFRLAEPEEARPPRAANWRVALPLSLVAAVVLAVLALPALDLTSRTPTLFLFGAPPAACAVIAFLVLAGGKAAGAGWRRAAPLIAALLVVDAYAAWRLGDPGRRYLHELMVPHLALLSVGAVVAYAVRGRTGAADRFPALVRLVDTIASGGLYVAAGGLMAAVTLGMFEALGIRLPEPVVRAGFGAGAGLIAVWAVATTYDPLLPPAEQRFDEGLSRLLSTLSRLLLPAFVLVLIAYLVAIPFRFWQPFQNREALVVYNLMLFVVMGLLIAATPVHDADLAPRYRAWLGRVIVAAAAAAALIGLHALSATAYRTALGGLTPNRLAVMGWNVLNIGLLIGLLWRARPGAGDPLGAIRSTFSAGILPYIAWTAFLVLAVPLLF